jgi:hypothetical protein
MNLVLGAVSAVAAGALIASIAPTRATQTGTPAIAAVSARNDALQSYTFHMDIAMAMRHFPWLHFRMEGLGDYRRGDHYVVHLTKMPWFASKIQKIDLSMIDPAMWPNRYRYEQAGQDKGDTIFALHALQDQSLASATVALNPILGARWVDAIYADGTHIHMNVSSNDVDGFLLPVTLTASVDYPTMPLSANANFTDYSITAPLH